MYVSKGNSKLDLSEFQGGLRILDYKSSIPVYQTQRQMEHSILEATEHGR